MENIVELLLFIFFIALTGLSATSKKAKEKHGSSESIPEETLFPTSTTPKTPPRPIRQESVKPDSHKTYSKGKIQQRIPPQIPAPDSSPAPVSTEPAWSRMLREMLELEQPQPEPVFEPPVQQKDRSKKLIRKNKQQTSPSQIPEVKPPERPIRQVPPPLRTSGHPIISNPLTEIINRSKAEPMRAAILLSEIIQPPRAKRKAIR